MFLQKKVSDCLNVSARSSLCIITSQRKEMPNTVLM